MTGLTWKIGFEIELLAPIGRSRKDLADALAKQAGGSVRRCFYPQSEPSLVPDTPVFQNLVLGYDVLDAEGRRLARCVDDLTLQSDLDRNAAPKPGWYRIVSDDARLLRLVMAQCDPDADLADVLKPVAALFGTEVTREDDDVLRLADRNSAPIALVTTLPGERERPCELITEPMADNHEERLASLLSPARECGFTVPAEAAVHLHFDAAALRDARVFRRLVGIIERHGENLRKVVATNPNCRRLGKLPDALFALARSEDFASLPWEEARDRLREVKLTKYVDFNLMNVIHDVPDKPTFEVRILPGSMDAAGIADQALLFEAILNWCVSGGAAEAEESGDTRRFIACLAAPDDRKRDWAGRVAGRWFDRLRS